MAGALRVAARQAAQAVREAQALLITAGAGMGVDSGLPDFRGTTGLWREYPPLRHLGLSFADMASPDWFDRDPCFAWGFYGHRLLLYRRTVPHQGFHILQRWAADMPSEHFVFTSNVDGQFQQAGVSESRVVECHGSIHYIQGLHGGPTVSSEGVVLPSVDPEHLRIPEPAVPRMPNGGGLARPNILMFGDWAWDGTRTDEQRRRLSEWMRGLRHRQDRVVIVELGAGEAVPTVRRTSEAAARELGACLVRINPREGNVPSHLRSASLACGALEGLSMIDAELEDMRHAGA